MWVTADSPWCSAAADPEIFYLLLQVEKALTYEKFIIWTKPDVMDEEEVEVFLPRFSWRRVTTWRASSESWP